MIDAPESAGESSSRWTAGRIAALIFGSLGALIGAAMLLGGLALIAAHVFVRDDDGYYTTDKEPLTTESYAITSGEIDLGADPVDWAPEEVLGTVRVRVESTNGRPVFVGIARTSDVDGYLGGVAHAVVTDFSDGEPTYEDEPGTAPPRPPSREPFWVAEGESAGEQSLEWDVESGIWSIVIMNGDGAQGIDIEADIGADIDWLIWAGLGLTVVGLLLGGGGVAMIVIAGRRAGRDSTPPASAPSASA